MKSNHLFWLCLVIILLSLSMWPFLNAQNPLKVPLIHRVKLLDVKSGHEEKIFRWPDALDYNLLVASATNASIIVTGELSLFERQTNILHFDLDPSSLISCSWLDNHGLCSYIVKMPNSPQDRELSSYLKGGNLYKIVVDNVPVGSSIWLDYRYPSGWDTIFSTKHRTKFEEIQLPK